MTLSRNGFLILGVLVLLIQQPVTAQAEDSPEPSPSASPSPAIPNLPAIPAHPARDANSGPPGLPPEIFANACQSMCVCTGPDGKTTPATARDPKDLPPGHPYTTAATGAGEEAAMHPHARKYGAPQVNDSDEVNNYPVAFVNRPQILPEGVTQPELVGGALNTYARGKIRERLSFAFQTPLASSLQMGLLANVAVDPKISLNSLYIITQVGLAPWINARLDLGARRPACGNGASALSGGFGLPIKYKLGDSNFAVISGRTAAFAQVDQIINWDIKACGSGASLGLPIGVLATFDEIFNFNIRTGYRYLLGEGNSTSFIPLGIDFAMMLGRQADVGVTFELPNALGTSNSLDRVHDFAFERRMFVFGQTRF